MQIPVTITWKSIGWIVAAIGAVISATTYAVWEVRKDVIEDLRRQISVYEQSKGWKLPETLAQLNVISEKLQEQFSERALLDKLKVEKQRALEANGDLQRRLTVSENLNASLQARTASLEADLQKSIAQTTTINLKQGESADLVRNRLSLGVSSIYSSWVTGYLDNESISINVGQNRSLEVSGKKCVLTLKRIEQSTAMFAFSCV